MDEALRALQDELIRFKRSLHIIRQSVDVTGLPPAGIPLLATLVHKGPARSGDLADAAFLDRSTVSRQIDQLVRSGHVRRTADPDDGRATLLEATDHGRSHLESHRQRMQDLLSIVVADWDEQTLRNTVTCLRRLNDDAATRLAPVVPRLAQHG